MRQKAKEFFAFKTKKDPAAYRQKITEIKKIFIALDSQITPEESNRLTNSLKTVVRNIVGHKTKF